MKRAALTVSVLAVVSLYAFPMAIVIVEAWRPSPFALSSASDLMHSATAQRAFWFSLRQALISASLTIAIGLPLAYVVARARPALRSIVMAIAIGAFMLPSPVVVTAFAAVFWTSGWLGKLHWQNTLLPMYLAHAFLNVGVVVLVAGTAWRNINHNMIDAARTLGATPRTVFLKLALRALFPAFASAFILIFVFCFSSFAVVLLLAPEYATIEVEIYRRFATMLDTRAAVMLAMVQVGFLGVLLFVVSKVGSGIRQGFSQLSQAEHSRLGKQSCLVAVWSIVGLTFLLLPIIALLVRSVTVDGNISFAYYRGFTNTESLPSVFQSLQESLGYAIIACPFALTAGIAASTAIYKSKRLGNLIEIVLALPLVTSGVVLGLGYLLGGAYLPVEFRNTKVLVPAAQASIAIPLVIRIITPALYSLSPDVLGSAQTLGAHTGYRIFKIYLPLILPAMIAATILALAVSIGDFGATSVIAASETPTLPLLIGRLLARPSAMSFGTGLAAGVLLFGVMVIASLVAQRLERR